mmetsp:Transcript_32880/g.37299  ORF Transcript_32880/g.37299 Transcript_32880/m.37299 type:complete len:443 (-) Transcript_32880:95-1423(-)
MEDKRYVDHSDLSPKLLELSSEQRVGKIKELIESELKEFRSNVAIDETKALHVIPEHSEENGSVFRGTAGYCIMYTKVLHLINAGGLALPEEDVDFCLEAGLKKAQAATEIFSKSTTSSLFDGHLGAHLAEFQLKSHFGNLSGIETLLNSILSYQEQHLNSVSSDELFVGRAGYIYALMATWAYLDENISRFEEESIEIDDYRRKIKAALKKVTLKTLEKGDRDPKHGYLYYEWHVLPYVGAAHGYGGILYALLSVLDKFPGLIGDEPKWSRMIAATLDQIESWQDATGNFPTVGGFENAKLVHWCHGAPGMIPLFCLASKYYRNDRYLQVASKAGECIWEKGVLKNGNSLCHGVTGNAYFFLTLYRYTQEKIWLQRAQVFGLLTIDSQVQEEQASHHHHQRAVKGKPDHPYSLMEGLAGTVSFLCDCLQPRDARFPCHELS